MNSLDTFTKQYIATALWSSTDDNDEPLDKDHDVKHIAPETLAKMVADCAKFQTENADDIGERDERAGHDFWLTRNGHGAGFWDGDYPEEIGKRLTEASKVYGEFNLYVGDDGLIYGS